ncbi:hypothetical protein HMPREF7215_1340 [Pyramidobacter piscolens W5455]|uniref:Uncharacterized protein n=1 Tax=Pyramidobacter piscolens W5455 TaxID=352165 RepID=A0ABM9ZSP3_9BACT|nr:hypothetical protein HMPREF7215_1340 [Pyramidobacter piscolens W5455]
MNSPPEERAGRKDTAADGDAAAPSAVHRRPEGRGLRRFLETKRAVAEDPS